MKIGFYNYYSFGNNNNMFLSSDSPIGDDLSYPTYYLGKFLKSLGFEVSTIDTDDISSYDIIIFLDLPKKNDRFFNQLKKYHKRLYLILSESPLVRPENWETKNHKVFKKVLVWNDEFVDSTKYFKYLIPTKIQTSFPLKSNKKLCTIISSNKIIAKATNELYSERIIAIRWFEMNHPLDFDLYGIGWNEGEPNKLFGKFINLTKTILKIYLKLRKYPIIVSLLKPFHLQFPSYIGKVESKNKTLTNYKFSICYENASNISGYITEKIFDCFFAGNIPVYLGAHNIRDYIPANTFIDKRDFKTYAELYSYMKNMTDNEYNSYLDAISGYLKSDSIQKFSAETFSKTIYNNIILDKVIG